MSIYSPINMSKLKILTFLAFTFIASGIVSGDSFSEELVVVSAEGGFYRLAIENSTLIGETELISPISTIATRPYCSNCGATYNGLLFDNWYFLPGLNGTILGLKSTQFNNLTFTSWKLGDCEPLALGVYNASKILYISCAMNNNTVSLRVIDLVHGGEPGIVAFEMNSSVSSEYNKSCSQNPGIFVEYNSSYHFISFVGRDLLVHKLDGFLVKHIGTYRAQCSSIGEIAVLKNYASLITRCDEYYTQIYIFNLYSAYFRPIFISPYTEQDYNIVVSYSGSYVAIWSSKEIIVSATSSWVFDTISNHNNSIITSLTFVESEGSVLIVYTVANIGVYTYNVTGVFKSIHGTETVSIIPGSKSVCSVDGCLGITSVGSLAVAANIGGGLLFYRFSSTSVTTYGPYADDYNITRVLPNPLSPSHNVTGTHSMLNIQGFVAGFVVSICLMTVGIILNLMLIYSRIRRKKKKLYFETGRLRFRYELMNPCSLHYDECPDHDHLEICCDSHPYNEGPINPGLSNYEECLDHDHPDICWVINHIECPVHTDLCPSNYEECLDHDHPDLCLPNSEEVGDVLKQAGCFVLGEIQTITIPETGGEWNLYPFLNDKRETCAMLSAPPGVVASGETVELMYGVIPSGPFVFPDGFELASVLIYLDCYDKEKLQKPLSLSLKHCITGDDEVLQNLLFFVKASHTPQDGSFVFKPRYNAVFDSESGTLEFTDFCLKGICVKKACEEIKEISTRCYAIPCQIQLHPTRRVSYEYRICLVFGLPSWENVFREYYCTRSEYNRDIHLPQEVEFKANQPIQSYVNESNKKGNGWQMMKLCDSVEFIELEIAVLKVCKMECERIIGELKVGLIFPHVRYVITSEREPTAETHGNRTVCITLRGCKPKDTHFYTFVREELRRERTPEGAEDGEEPSLAVQQQSSTRGSVLPGTFGNGFLDRTPSDVGLLEVVDKIKLGWRKIALYLGVSLTDVVAFESDQDLGGSRALQQWRDGREGCSTPATWNTLLAVVKDKLGVNVYADLEREVMTHEHWSIREETRH